MRNNSQRKSVKDRTNKSAFTLIELLIVVAIIAILAAIAVPNFLEAQTRAKVSRTKADMRTMATGIEIYFVDNNAYPTGYEQEINGETGRHSMYLLSTPISYLTSGQLQDPFATEVDNRPQYSTIQYAPVLTDGRMLSQYNIDFEGYPANEKPTWWTLISLGPDSESQFTYDLTNPPGVQYSVIEADNDLTHFANLYYDSSNGTISTGEIWRAGGSSLNQAGRFIQTKQ